ncbi:neuroglian-like isoform X3 [Biomphalaria glabrata]|uniref:Neuroglian-like isoform X3 n=1 Tax=Biomphalaria glabrata TaxID=6526 RepID=A0A9W2ZZM7_BIOGL|nr:neuroglian-like isoform X3 [Biomphalaria glabrata]
MCCYLSSRLTQNIKMKVMLLLSIAFVELVHKIYCETRPPKITKQGPKDILYKVNEMVKIECEASGEPAPSYTWKRADAAYSPEGNDERVVLQKAVGTLIINSPEDKDEGIYQCFASNSFGTAASIKFNLRMAKLEPFASSAPIYHRPHLGDYLKLNCSSPNSVPDGQVTWTVYDQGTYKAVIWDSRVTVDYDDNLHFVYVSSEDAMGGKSYHCMVSNKLMRMSVIGPPNYIIPTGTQATLSTMTKVWPTSKFDDTGLLGADWKIKCIFAGNPPPSSVTWKKKDSEPLENNNRVRLGNSGGQELIIQNLQMTDAGVYLCDANSEQEATLLEMSFRLSINAAPRWVSKPTDVTLIETGDAMFECLAVGTPNVQLFWFINGMPLEDALKADSRLDERFHHVMDSPIYFSNVSRSDALVVQCNVTNIHGYLWAEATLNVLAAEAPTILKGPTELRAAEGHSFLLPCQVTGKPDPTLTWYKESMRITGGRYLVGQDGSLHVQKSVLSDAGVYRCTASNTYGQVEASGSVIIRRKTLIVLQPMDLEVRSGINAKFTCSGTTDPEEISTMRTIWMKDHEAIQIGTRMFLNKQDNSLTISGTEQRDTGTYTCVITNGLDNDTASARLVVTEYSTALEPNHWVFATQVKQTNATAYIALPAGMDLKFRVTSYNKIGPSRPSEPSTQSCVTTEQAPAQHPKNLRTIGDQPGHLHIQWTPVPPELQGGRGCYYILSLTRLGQAESTTEHININDCRQYEHIHSSTGASYQPYQITIKSANQVNDCPLQAPTITGYSDEGAPQIVPFDLETSDITSELVTFRWKFDSREIGKNDSRIRGEFRGFKIQFWLQGYKQETIRDVDLRPDDLENQFNIYNASIKHLMPNARLEARVALLNNYFVSAPSETIQFSTPSGVSGPVQYLEEMNIADNHINLVWRPPLDNRGDLDGYDIGFQEVHGLYLGDLQERQPQIDDPFATTAMLPGLLPNTKYRIHIWPRTSAGRGEGFYIERTTTAPGVPNIPRFSIVEVGRDFINVSWWRDPYVSSGSVIGVEFRKEDGADWLSTSPEVSHDWVQIKGLQPGFTYVVRIVATTGLIRRISQEEQVRTDGTAKAYDISDNLGWLLSMLASLVVSSALLIGLWVCYHRGFTFKTQQEEIDVTTYRVGDETYTGTQYNTEEISSHSKERQEPVGHINLIYHDTYRNDSDWDDDVSMPETLEQESVDARHYRSPKQLKASDDYEEMDLQTNQVLRDEQNYPHRFRTSRSSIERNDVYSEPSQSEENYHEDKPNISSHAHSTLV